MPSSDRIGVPRSGDGSPDHCGLYHHGHPLCASTGWFGDAMVVQRLMVGLIPHSRHCSLLVDTVRGKGATGMTEQKRGLIAAIPFEVAMTLRPVLVDVESLTAFIDRSLDHFWLSQDSNVTPPVLARSRPLVLRSLPRWLQVSKRGGQLRVCT